MSRSRRRLTHSEKSAAAKTPRDRLLSAAVVLTGWSSFCALPVATGTNTGRVVAVFLCAALWLGLKAAGLLGPLPGMQRRLAFGVGAFAGVVLISAGLSEYAPRALTWGSLGFYGAPMWIALCVVFWGALHLRAEQVSPRLVALSFAWILPASAYALYQAGSGVLPSGGFNTGNHLAAMSVLTLPLALWIAFVAQDRALSLGAGAAALASATSILIARSAAGYLGLGLVLVVLAIIEPRLLGPRSPKGIRLMRTGALALFLVGATVLAIGLVGPSTLPAEWSQVMNREVYGATTQTRVEMWRAAGRVFAEHPVFGAGPDSYHLAAQKYLSARLFGIEAARGVVATPPDPHSLPLLLAASFGLVGVATALGVLGLWAYGIVGAIRSSRREPDGSLFTVSAAASTLGFLVVLLFVPMAAILGGSFAMVAGLAAGSLQPPGIEHGERTERPPAGPVRAACFTAAGGYVLLALLLLVGVVEADAAGRARSAEAGRAAYRSAARAMPTYPYWRFRELQVEGEQLRGRLGPLSDWQQRVGSVPEFRQDGTYLTALVRVSLDQAFRWGRKDFRWESGLLEKAGRVFPNSPELSLERAHLAVLAGDEMGALRSLRAADASALVSSRLDLYRYYIAEMQADTGRAAVLRVRLTPEYGPLALLDPQP